MWKWLLKKVMNYVVGADLFGQVQDLVADVALNENMTGAQKREAISKKADALKKDFASHLVNLAIESSVTLLKDKAK